jgi:hypothetical protein
MNNFNLYPQEKRPRQYADEICLLPFDQREAALAHVPTHLQPLTWQHVLTYQHLIEEPLIKSMINDVAALHAPHLQRNRLYTFQQHHPAIYDRVAAHFKGVA